MNCWFCNSQLIWQNDYTYADYQVEGDGLIVVLSCSNENCEAFCEISKSIK